MQEELRRLRARAYGPDADIDEDPAAYSRLMALEELDRAERAAVAAPPPSASPVETGAAGESSPADADDDVDHEVGDDDDGDDDDRSRSRVPLARSRRTVWAWAASLAVVAAIASAATTVGVGFVPVSASRGAPQVATLAEDPGTPVPAIFGQRTGDERAFADFYGVTAFVGTAQIDASENRSPCLYLIDTDEVGQEPNGFRGNFVYGGCGAGIFPATVQFIVADGMPEAFTSRFPIGTSVQFVYDGDNVGVFSDAG